MFRHFLALSFSFLAITANAADIKISLPIIPPLIEKENSGILVNLIQEMGKEYKDGKLIITGAYPFARSLDNVLKGNADVHVPLLKNPEIADDKLNYMYSSETFFNVSFYLYTKEDNKDINLTNLSKYKIDTDIAHTVYFPFKVEGSSSIEQSLKKLELGRIDGYIFAMPEVDAVIAKLNMKGIKKTLYKTFEAKAIFQKNDMGKKNEQIFSELLKKTKASGKYKEIMGSLI